MALRNEAVVWLQAYFNDSLDARDASGDPGDDMIGWLMTTEVEGERLTRENILDILGLLMIAGPRHRRLVARVHAQLLRASSRPPRRGPRRSLAVARRRGRAAAVRVAGHRRRAHRDERPRAPERRGDPRRHDDERLVVGGQRRSRLLPRPSRGRVRAPAQPPHRVRQWVPPVPRLPPRPHGAARRARGVPPADPELRDQARGRARLQRQPAHSAAPAAGLGADRVDQLRLHHRGRGLGRLRAGQPPVGEPGEPRAAARSGRQGQQPHDPHPPRLRQAPREPEVRVVLPDASVRPHRPGRGVGARQDPRRVELGERHGLQPRESGRLGRARAARQPRLGVELDPPGVQGVRGQPARRVADARRRRTARHLDRREPERDLRRDDRLRRRDRHAPRRRPERERRRTHRIHHGHDQERPAR